MQLSTISKRLIIEFCLCWMQIQIWLPITLSPNSFRNVIFMTYIRTTRPHRHTLVHHTEELITSRLGCGKLITSRYRSGSLSYFEGPQSDHRGLFVDLEIPYLTSSLRVQPLTHASQRFLHTGNPELVSSYLKSVREYYSAHRMEDTRINDLFHDTQQWTRVTF